MEKVIRFIKTNSLLKKGDFVVVGLSGGADSVYLLRVLCALRKDMDLTLLAVHVNHQLREDAAEDQRFAENLCRDFKVPLRIVSADVRAAAQKNKMSLEEAGREIRYAAFYEEFKRKRGRKDCGCTSSKRSGGDLFVPRCQRNRLKWSRCDAGSRFSGDSSAFVYDKTRDSERNWRESDRNGWKMPAMRIRLTQGIRSEKIRFLLWKQ